MATEFVLLEWLSYPVGNNDGRHIDHDNDGDNEQTPEGIGGRDDLHRHQDPQVEDQDGIKDNTIHPGLLDLGVRPHFHDLEEESL